MTPTTPEAVARRDKLAERLHEQSKGMFTMEQGADDIRSAIAELSALRAELARVAPLAEAAREYAGAKIIRFAETREALFVAALTFASQDEAG